MRRRLAAPFLLAASLPSGLAAQAAGWWLPLVSREARRPDPPRLVLVTRVRRFTYAAAADAALVRYRADRPWGRLPLLSVGNDDQNRVLLRFDLPRRLRPRDLRRAELHLTFTPSPRPPPGRVTLALHVVRAAWDEARVTWRNQPPVEARAAREFTVQPGGGKVRVEITAVVRRWLAARGENHGLLLKVAGTPVGLEGALYRTLPWRTDVAAARATARKEGKLVLALVRADLGPARENLPELLLLAVAFADPDVVALVRAHAVPVRLAYRPSLYTHRRGGGKNDPLRLLGTTVVDTKAPALLVATAAGKLVARLETIGTFDAEMIYRWLRRAFRAAGRWREVSRGEPEVLLRTGALAAAAAQLAGTQSPRALYLRACIAAREGDHARAVRLAHAAARDEALRGDATVQGGVSLLRLGDFIRARRLLREALAVSPPSSRVAEALYYLGCLAARAGDEDEARRLFQQILTAHRETLWAVKAAARLRWPARLQAAENLRSLTVPPLLGSTEQAVAAPDRGALRRRALEYLLEQQEPAGTWPVEHPMNRSAVTALAAKALCVWAERVPPELAARLRAAEAKARAWIARHVRTADPQTAFSFGGAYILDYLLTHTRRRQGKDLRGLIVRAIRFLEAQQCPNGAWSYSFRFNQRWRGGFGGWPRTTAGRVHSMNTGVALLYLATARRRGLPVDTKRFARAVRALKAMRTAPGVYTYTYPKPLNFRRPDQSIARGPVCEHALYRAGAAKKEDLEKALTTFMECHKDLRLPVKLNPTWGNPHAFSSYFFFFAYYHAALALVELGDARARKRLHRLQEELYGVPELDATWVDYQLSGKPYGTAVALLVLAAGSNDAASGGDPPV